MLAAGQVGAGWAFEALYRDLSPLVRNYLRLHGASDPDDLASETFLSVLTGLGSFHGDEGKFRAWVFTIAHRRLVDEWRRAGRRPQNAEPGEGLLERLGGNAEDDALDSLGAQAVEELCASLSPDQRAVLLLRILADLTVEQVAEALGRSVPSVKALQRRGLRTLRGEILDRGAPL